MLGYGNAVFMGCRLTYKKFITVEAPNRSQSHTELKPKMKPMWQQGISYIKY